VTENVILKTKQNKKEIVVFVKTCSDFSSVCREHFAECKIPPGFLKK
jgi:hypothetical protein